MAPPYHFPTATSPYNFGLGSDFEIALILPFLYFFSSVFPDIFLLREVAPKTPSLTGMASPGTCGLTQPDELLASLDQRRNTTREQAAISLFFIAVICFASHYHEFKRDDSWDVYSGYASSAALLKYWLYGDDPVTPYASPAALLKYWLYGENPVTPPDDYRMTKRREAMRLLFLVVISALFCPIADYLCGRGEEPFASGLDNWDLSLSYVGKLTIPVMFVFYRYGAMRGVQAMILLSRITGPCVITAAATKALALATFGRRYGVVDIWDRRVERWVEAWEKEKFKAETAEWEILRERGNPDLPGGKYLWQVRDEEEIGERNKELLVWRRGMKEGRGYGPDYWLPREKGPQRPFQYSGVVGDDAYHPRGTGCGRDCKGGVRLPFPGFQIHSASNG